MLVQTVGLGGAERGQLGHLESFAERAQIFAVKRIDPTVVLRQRHYLVVQRQEQAEHKAGPAPSLAMGKEKVTFWSYDVH